MKTLKKKHLNQFREEERNTIKNINPIKWSLKQKSALFFSGLFACFFKKKSKLIKVYKEGQKRIEKEFDISKIIVKLRNVSIFLKDKIFDETTKFEVKNNYKAVIHDESTESEQEQQQQPEPD